VLVGFISVTVSVLVTGGLTLLARIPAPMFWVNVGIGTCVPAMVAPPIAWLVATLMLEVDKAREIAEHLAITDPLTGVFNRRQFQTLAENEFARAARLQLPTTVLLIDIDRFKSVNDIFGHAVGDEVIRAVARACIQELRPYDIFARYGGEEFVVLLPETGRDAAAAVAERLRLSVTAVCLTVAAEKSVTPTISVGVATQNSSVCSLSLLLTVADFAMYRAKNDGRNRVHVA
jgi:diguanylate cyclase (GGDEF)-like protein